MFFYLWLWPQEERNRDRVNECVGVRSRCGRLGLGVASWKLKLQCGGGS